MYGWMVEKVIKAKDIVVKAADVQGGRDPPQPVCVCECKQYATMLGGANCTNFCTISYRLELNPVLENGAHKKPFK